MKRRTYTEGIATRQELMDESLIDEGHYFRAGIVLHNESPSMQQMNSAGAHEIGTDEAVESRITFKVGAAAYIGCAVHRKAITRKWDGSLHGRGLHTGKGLEALQQASISLAQSNR